MVADGRLIRTIAIPGDPLRARNGDTSGEAPALYALHHRGGLLPLRVHMGAVVALRPPTVPMEGLHMRGGPTQGPALGPGRR